MYKATGRVLPLPSSSPGPATKNPSSHKEIVKENHAAISTSNSFEILLEEDVLPNLGTSVTQVELPPEVVGMDRLESHDACNSSLALASPGPPHHDTSDEVLSAAVSSRWCDELIVASPVAVGCGLVWYTNSTDVVVAVVWLFCFVAMLMPSAPCCNIAEFVVLMPMLCSQSSFCCRLLLAYGFPCQQACGYTVSDVFGDALDALPQQIRIGLFLLMRSVGDGGCPE
ncbi:hypothetical protein Nepgr_007977 [Nepenthes gracilis]|uniref:Uncharacterized protein n=1 Tax=Nepenthes gracilis TaxID=150966 RepID=A0AAD3S8Q7_NEPGR|nr:hypothetical protein Nepgr_007977 [Nepenthes gracilis]